MTFFTESEQTSQKLLAKTYLDSGARQKNDTENELKKQLYIQLQSTHILEVSTFFSVSGCNEFYLIVTHRFIPFNPLACMGRGEESAR